MIFMPKNALIRCSLLFLKLWLEFVDDPLSDMSVRGSVPYFPFLKLATLIMLLLLLLLLSAH